MLWVHLLESFNSSISGETEVMMEKPVITSMLGTVNAGFVALRRKKGL